MKGNYKLFFITIILLSILVSCSTKDTGREVNKEKNTNENTLNSEPEIGTTFQIGTTKAKLVKELGKPQEDMHYLGGRLFRYENGGYFLDDKEKVNGMYIIDPKVKISKARVGMTIEEIIQYLGKPVESYYDEGETQFYCAVFKINDWKIIFSSVDESSPTSYALALYSVN